MSSLYCSEPSFTSVSPSLRRLAQLQMRWAQLNKIWNCSEPSLGFFFSGCPEHVLQINPDADFGTQCRLCLHESTRNAATLNNRPLFQTSSICLLTTSRLRHRAGLTDALSPASLPPVRIKPGRSSLLLPLFNRCCIILNAQYIHTYMHTYEYIHLKSCK